jgi:ribA/ribD-fused uncharacterized protein
MAITHFDNENFFLSNFYPVEILMDGVIYPTLEHAYQASKTLDKCERALVLKARKPGYAKRLGRQLTLRKDWEQVKLAIMKDLLEQKFSYRDLKKKLLATGNKEIIEGNHWHDTYWGVCDGKGLNMLGKLLMEVRNNMTL